METLYGGIEAGGTWFVCAVGTGPDRIAAEIRFPTTTPEETLQRSIEFFKDNSAKGNLTAIGVGSFGPVGVDSSSSNYGRILFTPKLRWASFDILGMLQNSFSIPVVLDTDVNAAALGEQRWGAAQGLHTFIYLTIGTGIGGGVMMNGKLLHGLLHPEIGHMRIPHDREKDPFDGTCPYHDDCLEGLASGPSLEKRWGRKPATLPVDHPAWALEAGYLAFGLNNIICDFSPQRIILGGGIMDQTQLLQMIRRKVQVILNGYLPLPEIVQDIDRYIITPGLGKRAGVLGAIALASDIYKN